MAPSVCLWRCSLRVLVTALNRMQDGWFPAGVTAMAHKSSTEAQPLLHTQPHTRTNPYSLQLNHDHCIHYIKGHWGAHIVDWASMQTDVFTDLKLCMLLPYSAVTMVDLWHQCMRLLSMYEIVVSCNSWLGQFCNSDCGVSWLSFGCQLCMQNSFISLLTLQSV